MAYDYSTINPFVDETSQDFILKAVVTGRTVDNVRLVTGVKGKQAIPILDNTVNVQYGSCGFTSAGNVAIKQVEVEVEDLAVNDNLCPRNLEPLFMGMRMKAGSPKEEPIGPMLAQSYVDAIRSNNEFEIWQGNKTSSPQVGHIDGFLVKLLGESSRVKVEAGSPNFMEGPFTVDNIRTVIENLILDRPEELIDKPNQVMFISYANYQLYTSALRAANMYHYSGENGSEYKLTIPGTEITMIATNGLKNRDEIVLTYADNLIIATDLENEEEQFDIFWARENNEVRVIINFKLGTAITFPELVVTNF